MAIAFDTANGAQGTVVATLSANLTVAGSQRIMVMGTGHAGTLRTINTPTWNASAVGVTQQDSTRSGPSSTFRSAIFTLIAPTTGTLAYQSTLSAAADEFGICASTYTGVDQTTGVRASTGAIGTNSEASVALNNVQTNDWIVDFTNMWGTAIVVNPAQTSRNEQENIGAETSTGMSSRQSVDTYMAFGWTETGGSGNEWTYHVVDLIPFGPSISANPLGVTKYEGETANFTITATGTGVLNYQWKDDGANVGTNSNSYTTAALVVADSGSIITCVVTDDNGTNTSNNALLTVLTASKPYYRKA